VPPVPQAFCIALASCSFSGRPMPIKFLTTVTVLPPRPAFCRTISTGHDSSAPVWILRVRGICGPGGRPSWTERQRDSGQNSARRRGEGWLISILICAFAAVKGWSGRPCLDDAEREFGQTGLAMVGVSRFELGLFGSRRSMWHPRIVA
jgi:hypothetical protein